MKPIYLSIRLPETGNHIKQLLKKSGYTVRDIQSAMGFENPQAIYKWMSGKTLPSLDNLVILSKILHSSMEDILVIDGDVVFYTLTSGSGRVKYAILHFPREGLCGRMVSDRKTGRGLHSVGRRRENERSKGCLQAFKRCGNSVHRIRDLADAGRRGGRKFGSLCD